MSRVAAPHTENSIVYDGMPHIYDQNCPFPFDDHHPCLIHPSLDRPHSPPQTISGSNQPFCRNTLQTDRQMDKQTNRWDKRQLCQTLDDAAKKVITPFKLSNNSVKNELILIVLGRQNRKEISHLQKTINLSIFISI